MAKSPSLNTSTNISATYILCNLNNFLNMIYPVLMKIDLKSVEYEYMCVDE